MLPLFVKFPSNDPSNGTWAVLLGMLLNHESPFRLLNIPSLYDRTCHGEFCESSVSRSIQGRATALRCQEHCENL